MAIQGNEAQAQCMSHKKKQASVNERCCVQTSPVVDSAFKRGSPKIAATK